LMPSDTGVMPPKIQPYIYVTKLSPDVDQHARCELFHRFVYAHVRLKGLESTHTICRRATISRLGKRMVFPRGHPGAIPSRPSRVGIQRGPPSFTKAV
jgi:hypothetical protein